MVPLDSSQIMIDYEYVDQILLQEAPHNTYSYYRHYLNTYIYIYVFIFYIVNIPRAYLLIYMLFVFYIYYIIIIINIPGSYRLIYMIFFIYYIPLLHVFFKMFFFMMFKRHGFFGSGSSDVW